MDELLMDELLIQAQKCADVVGANFILGLRPGGTPFVHCGGVEYDGSFDASVPAVIEAHRERAKAMVDTARSNIERAGAILQALS